jgi:outer membrane protein OmpA-like peptidoglycan-associated protein
VTAPRFLSLLAAGLAFATAARAQTPQTPYYRPLYEDEGRYDAPGFRIGLSAGAMTYFGPDILNVNTAAGATNGIDDQDNVTQTRPAVLAFVSFPLGSDHLYGRLQAGLANLGADFRADVPVAAANPFLTNEWFIGEGNLLFNLISPRRSATVPYLFSGFGAIVADPFDQDESVDALGHETVAYYVPAGVGVDFRLSRNLSLFLEAAYRFNLNNPGRAYTITGGAAATGGTTGAGIFANATTGDPCEEKPWKPECGPKPPEEDCTTNPELPGCVAGDDSTQFDNGFNVGSLMGGIAIGFAPAPRAFIPPPVAPTPNVPPVVAPVVEERPPLPVCELVELNSVYFDYGSASLTPGARALLAENVQLLRENPECCIFIDGYTDTSEYDRFGMPLAGRRAQAVYDYYLESGVEASRMHVRNRGASLPDCDKEDEGPGCRRGRRVDTLPMDCERFRQLLESPSF